MRISGEDIQTASQNACENMTERFGGDGGVVAIDKDGNVGIAFSSEQMSWAYQKEKTVHYGINRGDDFEFDVENNF